MPAGHGIPMVPQETLVRSYRGGSGNGATIDPRRSAATPQKSVFSTQPRRFDLFDLIVISGFLPFLRTTLRANETDRSNVFFTKHGPQRSRGAFRREPERRAL